MQFLYGEDGMDGTAIESQKLEHLRMTEEKFRVRHNPCSVGAWLEGMGHPAHTCS